MPDKILIVDDDEAFRSEFKELFDYYDVIEASDGQSALKLLKSANDIGLILLDVMMPGISGIEVLKEIKKTDPDVGIVILTGYSSKDLAIKALKGHADDYIEKPIDLNKTREIIEKAFENKRGEDKINTGDIPGKIEKVKSFIKRNCYKKTSLTDVSKAVCLSPKYLSRIFKNSTGVNFIEYKLRIKMEKAKELLVKTGYNVNQISDKLGYENAESFIRQFNKLAGSTPTEYRRKYLKKKNKKL
ncbi:MAG: response regulator [bacterium]|nr:response regulator [bacterium]